MNATAPEPAPSSHETPADHLLRHLPPLLRVEQVMSATGFKRSTIYNLCGDGELLYHALPGRQRERRVITRSSVALLLLRTAAYDAAQVGTLFQLVLPALSAEALRELQTTIAADLAQRSSPKS